MPKIKSIRKNLILFTASLFFSSIGAIVLLELYFSGKHHHNAVTRFDSKLGWTNKANAHIEKNGVIYSTNSMGFRSSEVDEFKNHILVIGDSVTFGLGVENNETVTTYLSNYFSEYQIFNLGVSGYGIDQSFLRLKENISRLNSKFVIAIIFSGNDWGEIGSDGSYGLSKPFFTVDASFPFSGEVITVDPNKVTLTNYPAPRFSCMNIFTKSYLLKFSILSSARNFLCKPRTLDFNETYYIFISLLVKIGELVSKNNSGLLYVLSPTKSDFKYDFKLANSDFKKAIKKNSWAEPGLFNKHTQLVIQNIFQRSNLPYLDFYKVIKENKWKVDDLYLPNDQQHLSPLGHALMAKAINAHLQIKKH